MQTDRWQGDCSVGQTRLRSSWSDCYSKSPRRPQVRGLSFPGCCPDELDHCRAQVQACSAHRSLPGALGGEGARSWTRAPSLCRPPSATGLRSGCRPHDCSAPCAWGHGARGSPEWCADPRPGRPSEPSEAHPALWGPFALVGEGGSSMPPSLTTQGVTSPATPSVAPSKGPARLKPKPSTQKGDWKTTIWKDGRP